MATSFYLLLVSVFRLYFFSVFCWAYFSLQITLSHLADIRGL